MRSASLLLAAMLTPSGFALAEEAPAEPLDLGEMIVTAPMTSGPLTVETDPKAPRQPIPASDGGSYLDNIPGFAVSRKGGTDGDAALRGLGGSRLNILLDDAYIFGGCGQRMDPPTAYAYPESYDKITVLKGPQSVRYGATVSGNVLFERDTARFEEPGTRANASAVFGSFGRNDQMFDVTGGNPTGYLRAIGTRSDADDYKDGDGESIHSAYTRWSGTAIGGWTPDADSEVKISYDASDGEAAYADRMMDGVKFDRTGYAAEFSKRNLSPLLERIELKAYSNYVDHVMDNYTLREPMVMMGNTIKSVSNPDRDTQGARFEAQLGLGEGTFSILGLDYQTNSHSVRKARTTDGSDPVLGERLDKASFATTGLFAEVEHTLAERSRLVGGLRVDLASAEAEQLVTMDDPDAYGGAEPGTTDDDRNTSGFLRYERDTRGGGIVYAGIGRAQRSPDFWERDRLFELAPEKNTQLDVGVGVRSGALTANLALFYADIADYILIVDNGSAARNIDATTYGGELDLAYALARHWKLTATVALVHGENDTDDKPLAQMPPLEGTLGLNYNDNTYSAGLLVRGADRQDRVDVGSGTIYGTDIGETPGFGVLSLNAGYRPSAKVLLAVGIDNLLDRTYAEHLGRGSADLGTVTGRVNEPGRNYWLKASAYF